MACQMQSRGRERSMKSSLVQAGSSQVTRAIRKHELRETEDRTSQARSFAERFQETMTARSEARRAGDLAASRRQNAASSNRTRKVLEEDDETNAGNEIVVPRRSATAGRPEPLPSGDAEGEAACSQAGSTPNPEAAAPSAPATSSSPLVNLAVPIFRTAPAEENSCDSDCGAGEPGDAQACAADDARDRQTPAMTTLQACGYAADLAGVAKAAKSTASRAGAAQAKSAEASSNAAEADGSADADATLKSTPVPDDGSGDNPNDGNSGAGTQPGSPQQNPEAVQSGPSPVAPSSAAGQAFEPAGSASAAVSPVSQSNNASAAESGSGAAGQGLNSTTSPEPDGSSVAVSNSHPPISSVVFQMNAGPDTLSGHAGKPESSLPAGTQQVIQEKAFAAWQSVSEQTGQVDAAMLNLVQNGTELRVRMRTDAFGPVEVLATLEGGKVGAAIGVESSEGHHALLGQVAALQQSLAEQKVQLDHVSVVRTFSQSTSDFGSGSSHQREEPAPFAWQPQQSWEPSAGSEPAYVPETETRQPENLWGRLSVRA
jgi:Flagellar hook-length control protein FliK